MVLQLFFTTLQFVLNRQLDFRAKKISFGLKGQSLQLHVYPSDGYYF